MTGQGSQSACSAARPVFQFNEQILAGRFGKLSLRRILGRWNACLDVRQAQRGCIENARAALVFCVAAFCHWLQRGICDVIATVQLAPYADAGPSIMSLSSTLMSLVLTLTQHSC